jgi:glycerophosphoryl diester phosphodiesterase
MAHVKPLVCAHRGASHDIGEHTLGAYVEALDAGADALECDVRLTRDGHLVLHHDRTLRRTVGVDKVLSELTLAELREYDFAAWRRSGPRDPGRDWNLDTILTLRDYLTTVRDAGRRVELFIETKHPVRYRGQVEHRLADMLREFGLDRPGSPVRVMSFHVSAVYRMQRLTPALPQVMLIESLRAWRAVRPLVRREWAIGPGIKLLREAPQIGAWARQGGHELSVWTVNSEADLEFCLDQGVAAITTDRPAWALAQLAQRA